MIIFLILFDFFKFNSKIKKSVFFILGLLLIYKAGTRIDGIDYDSYSLIYNKIQNNILDKSTRLEPIFRLLFSISPKKIIAFSLIATISIFLKLNSILKYSVFPFLSLVLYYYSFYYSDDMGRIRVGFAVAILAYGIRYLNNNKKFLLILFLGILCHKSVILYLIPFLLNKINLNEKKISCLIIFSVVLGLINLVPIVEYISKINYFSSTISLYYRINEKIGFSSVMLFKLINVILFSWNYKKLISYRYFKENFICFLSGVCTYFSFNSFAIIATRGSEVFTGIEFIILPFLLKITDKILFKYLILIYLILAYGYMGRKFILLI